ncbi:MAG: hypothetical protein R2806_21395, partial [Saprospiraceae bacterium]
MVPLVRNAAQLCLIFFLFTSLLTSCGSDEEIPSAAPAPSFAPPSQQALTVEGFVVKPQTIERTLQATGSLLANESVPIQ